MSGLLLVVAGVLVLTQVLGGDALGRLGVTSSDALSPEARGEGGGMSPGGGKGSGGGGGRSF